MHYSQRRLVGRHTRSIRLKSRRHSYGAVCIFSICPAALGWLFGTFCAPRARSCGAFDYVACLKNARAFLYAFREPIASPPSRHCVFGRNVFSKSGACVQPFSTAWQNQKMWNHITHHTHPPCSRNGTQLITLSLHRWGLPSEMISIVLQHLNVRDVPKLMHQPLADRVVRRPHAARQRHRKRHRSKRMRQLACFNVP